MALDLGRASRSTRTKHAKYRDLSDSDSESEQSNYDEGEAIDRAPHPSDSDSDSEDLTLLHIENASKNSSANYVGRKILKNFDGTDYSLASFYMKLPVLYSTVKVTGTPIIIYF